MIYTGGAGEGVGFQKNYKSALQTNLVNASQQFKYKEKKPVGCVCNMNQSACAK